MLDKALLWSLEYPNGNISYLFGTMHVKDELAFRFEESAILKMESCTHYYAEMDLNEASQLIKPRDYYIPNDQNLVELLGPKKFEKLNKILVKAFNFNLEPWINFYPVIICNKIAEQILNEERSQSLDAFLWTQAIRLNLNLGGVETVQEQIDCMKRLDLNHQIKVLKSVCKNVNKYKNSILGLREMYANGEILKLYKATKKSLSEFKKPLLIDRNINMTESILQKPDEKAFFAVGAAHLAGYLGILRLLKNKGIKLKAIN